MVAPPLERRRNGRAPFDLQLGCALPPFPEEVERQTQKTAASFREQRFFTFWRRGWEPEPGASQRKNRFHAPKRATKRQSYPSWIGTVTAFYHRGSCRGPAECTEASSTMHGAVRELTSETTRVLAQSHIKQGSPSAASGGGQGSLIVPQVPGLCPRSALPCGRAVRSH